MSTNASYGRRLRFFLLEKIVLPIAIVPLRMLVWSWRMCGPDPGDLRALMTSPRAIVATYHGMFVHLLAYSRLPPKFGRRLVVLVSPSRDGRLLAATMAHFGIDSVFGSSASRGVGGAREFIRRINAGDIGVVAADGPRGPCCMAKPGLLQIAEMADASIFLMLTSARSGVTLSSWDRTHLPGPRADTAAVIQPFQCPAQSDEQRLAALQADLLRLARQLDSPVLPEALRQMPEGLRQVREN